MSKPHNARILPSCAYAIIVCLPGYDRGLDVWILPFWVVGRYTFCGLFQLAGALKLQFASLSKFREEFHSAVCDRAINIKCPILLVKAKFVKEMEKLSDDLLGLIFGKLSSKYDRKSCTRVCSQWRRVESATRSSIKILDPQYLPFFLPRYRNLRVIEAGKGVCDLDLELIADICPLLQILNLNLPTTIAYVDLLYDSHVDVVTDHGISELAPKCKHLREIHLKRRKVVGDLGLRNLLKSCHNLVHLDIAFCNRITDQSLEAIAGSGCLEILVLQGCTLVTDRGICLLADGSAAKSLKTLDLSECDRITDSGVEVLPKFSCLKVVSLAACGSRITDNGVTLLGKISTLETVNISWLVNVSDESLFVLARSCRNLKEINISGSELVTGDGIAAFSGHPCLQALILDACYNILAEDIEQIVLGCSSLEYLGLDRAFRYWISNDTLHRMEGLCRIEWL